MGRGVFISRRYDLRDGEICRGTETLTTYLIKYLIEVRKIVSSGVLKGTQQTPHALVHPRCREAGPWATLKAMAAPLGHVVLLSTPIIIFLIQVKFI